MSKKDHCNTVELIGTYGDDETHALSAWTSTSRDLTDEKRGRIGRMLKQLGEAGHHSVFEKSSIHLLVNTEIATHIQILKHRIGMSCVTGDTIIQLKNPGGSITKITIEDLYAKYNNGIKSTSSNGKEYTCKYTRNVWSKSLDEETGTIVKGRINQVFCNGIKEVFQITTSDGKTIKCTQDHKFYFENIGWAKLEDGIGMEKRNGKVGFTIANAKIATNGTVKSPWTERSFFDNVENTMTRLEAAKYLHMTYPNLKKWGSIHKIVFKEDMNKDFKKGNVPWNDGLKGYKVTRKKNGLKKIGSDTTYSSKKIWRAAVGNWTREQLPSLLKKYGYTCQGNLSVHSRDFVCHHIIPVAESAELSCDIDNLILLCVDCHKDVHKSINATIEFANAINSSDIKTFANLKPKVGPKLRPLYTKIVSIEYIGKELVYDLEIENYHNYIANGFIIHNCNAESARYKELKDNKFYIPQDWKEDEQAKLIEHCQSSIQKYHDCLARLVASGMPRKRAKESARFYLPYANQITADIMFNFRSLMHFVGLRFAPDAQVEIRELAQKILIATYETGKFNASLEAFGWTKEKIYEAV